MHQRNIQRRAGPSHGGGRIAIDHGGQRFFLFGTVNGSVGGCINHGMGPMAVDCGSASGWLRQIHFSASQRYDIGQGSKLGCHLARAAKDQNACHCVAFWSAPSR